MLFLPPENTLHTHTPHHHIQCHCIQLYYCVSTQNGSTALHMAAHEGKVDVVRLLLTEAQTLVNIQTKV